MLNINYEEYYCGGFPLQIYSFYYNKTQFRVIKNHSSFCGVYYSVDTIKTQNDRTYTYYGEVEGTTAKQLFELLNDSNNDENSIMLWLELNIINN